MRGGAHDEVGGVNLYLLNPEFATRSPFGQIMSFITDKAVDAIRDGESPQELFFVKHTSDGAYYVGEGMNPFRQATVVEAAAVAELLVRHWGCRPPMVTFIRNYPLINAMKKAGGIWAEDEFFHWTPNTLEPPDWRPSEVTPEDYYGG